MNFLDLVRIGSRNARRKMELVLLVSGALYLLSWVAVRALGGAAMIPFFLSYGVILTITLATLHYCNRMNYLLLIAAIWLLGPPFVVVFSSLVYYLRWHIYFAPVILQGLMAVGWVLMKSYWIMLACLIGGLLIMYIDYFSRR